MLIYRNHTIEPPNRGCWLCSQPLILSFIFVCTLKCPFGEVAFQRFHCKKGSLEKIWKSKHQISEFFFVVVVLGNNTPNFMPNFGSMGWLFVSL